MLIWGLPTLLSKTTQGLEAVGVIDFEIAGCVVSPKNNSYPVR